MSYSVSCSAVYNNNANRLTSPWQKKSSVSLKMSKNLVFGIYWISQRMRIVAPIQKILTNRRHWISLRVWIVAPTQYNLLALSGNLWFFFVLFVLLHFWHLFWQLFAIFLPLCFSHYYLSLVHYDITGYVDEGNIIRASFYCIQNTNINTYYWLTYKSHSKPNLFLSY